MRLHLGQIKFERTTWKNNPPIYVCTLRALSVVERLGMGRKVKVGIWKMALKPVA